MTRYTTTAESIFTLHYVLYSCQNYINKLNEYVRSILDVKIQLMGKKINHKVKICYQTSPTPTEFR